MKTKSLAVKDALASQRRLSATRSRVRAAKATTLGQRVGSKRRDMRWQAPDGTIWASRFEYEVFISLKTQKYAVRKTDNGDAVDYRSPIQQGICLDCKSECVAQRRSYTPDLYFRRSGDSDGYYIEAKGYIRQQRRALLRAFRKSNPEFPLRLIIQRDYSVTAQLSLKEWATKYLKVPVHVWNGSIPDGWQ